MFKVIVNRVSNTVTSYTCYEFKMSSKCIKYFTKFKLQVVKFTQESNNCAAGREFCINKKLVRDWRKQVEKLECMPKNKCSNRGKLCQWPELEDKLLQCMSVGLGCLA